MLRQRVLGVGWDVGGWIGRKQAVAIAEWNDHSAQWLGTPMRFSIAQLGEHWGVDDLVRCAWPEALSAILETRELVMAIDAPLGFPIAFSELLAGRSTPSFDPSGPEIENPFAYRETDRHIYRTFRKKSCLFPIKLTSLSLRQHLSVRFAFFFMVTSFWIPAAAASKALKRRQAMKTL